MEQFLEFIDEAPTRSVSHLSRRVLQRCRALTGAEAGTIFIARHQGRRHWLEAVAIQNDIIKVDGEHFKVPIDLTSIAGYVASTRQTLTIADAYEISPDLPYHFNRAFDLATGFRTRSILCFALKGFRGAVIGIVQLINRRSVASAEVLPFLPEHERMIAPVNHLVGRTLERAAFTEELAKKNEKLRQRNQDLRAERAEVDRLHAETERAFMQSVELLARAAELHDVDTGNHILRVNEYSNYIAKRLNLPAAFCFDIHAFAALHDVGKISIDKAVLHKNGRLNEREMLEMQSHTSYGYQILAVSPRLAMAAEIAHGHHEKWDGSGYPNRKRGEEIPLAARIVALADVYDALRSVRPYKPSLSHERAVAIISDGDDRIDPASHFDPAIHRLFIDNHGEFARIWDRLTEGVQ